MTYSELFAAYQAGHTLPQEFYTEEGVFQHERRILWGNTWLFAGHACEIARPGQYRLFTLGNDSLLLMRDHQGQLRALHNVCRHRGSRLCTAEQGTLQQIVCPYHQWCYASDGRLLATAGSQMPLDKQAYSLIPAAIEEVAGLLFIHLGDTPPSFVQAQQAIASVLAPYELASARVAYRMETTVLANWKLIVENNRECYHCPANHPEYCQATYDTRWDDPSSTKEIEAQTQRCQQQWAALGQDPRVVRNSSQMTGKWFRANRTPLRQGFLSESLDGQEVVARRLGAFTQADGSVSRVTTFPNFWCHASTDHAVTTRLLPLSASATQICMTWLVHAEARERRDYALERLIAFWQRTAEQDWSLCENQHAGVLSSRYQPGPSLADREPNIGQFWDWYYEQMRP